MHLADPVFSRLSLVVLSCAPALMVPCAIASRQAERDAGTALRRQVVTGRAVMPDGSAASGAVVVTSAGGECVTGADGRFVLEVELAADAEDLAVTAVADAKGDGSFVAHARIVPAGPASIASVGRLVLAPSLSCASRWLPTFGAGAGADAHVYSLAVFDDGDGPALYAGGGFTKGIVKWNGSGWSTLAGAPRDVVYAMTVFDDGSGPALFAGGSGLESNAIAKWDGSSWSDLGSGMPTGHQVFALELFDDGGGPALYAAGPFTTAGGVAASFIAKWDGSSWSALGSGMNNTVFALEVFDGGNGPALYAAGLFGSAGGVVVNRIAKWDGSSWSALGTGINAYAKALAVFDDGGGPALYVGGNFTSAGGIAASGVARWDGSSWSALGSGTGGSERIIEALTVFDDGGGPALYAAGYFTTAGGLPANRVARWDGSSWSALGNGLNGLPEALVVYDDGSGPLLYAGGGFTTAGDVAAPGIATWDGASWSTLAGGLACPVGATTVFDDGTGPALYAGGLYDYRARSSGIAKWDGASWTPLGSPVSDGDVTALAVFDDGGGPALHAGGSYGIGGVSGHVIVRWDGSSWSPVGSGLHGGGWTGPHVYALVVHDDGGGPALYAGGEFFTSGSSAVARWDGSSWSGLGTGIGGPPSSTPHVRALAVYDEGSGPMLFAGGDFTTAGGVSANGIARWDGSSWSALGAGVGGPLPVVHALAVFDDGNGPALYAGGSFTTAGGVAASRIARWDGSSWSTVGVGTGKPVNTLAVFDDGDGPALFAGGAFNNAGGVFARRIARWDGSTWSALGKGLDGDVATLVSWDDGNGPALYAGGEFIGSPSNDSYLAKWGCRPKATVRQRKL